MPDSKWIEENKYEIIGPQRELYLKGELITSDPNEYITEIQFPVQKNRILQLINNLSIIKIVDFTNYRNSLDKNYISKEFL